MGAGESEELDGDGSMRMEDETVLRLRGSQSLWYCGSSLTFRSRWRWCARAPRSGTVTGGAGAGAAGRACSGLGLLSRYNTTKFTRNFTVLVITDRKSTRLNSSHPV